jgi:phospholipase/lecithinase/hemolysin
MLLVFTATCTAYPAIFVYGDSLSDNGNLYTATGYPPAPYYMGRFSNGPVAVEQLAAQLGTPLYDFAWGGATTGIGNEGDPTGLLGLPGMLSELAGYPVPPALIPSSLFVVWGGANDYEVSVPLGTPPAQVAGTAVANIDAIVAALQAEGAQHILVPGLPDLSLTPEFYGVQSAQDFSNDFNADLQASLPTGATYDNVFGLLDTIVANPSAYGFTNVTTPCFNSVTLTVCADPSQYLFWDDIHPTTAADAFLADEFHTDVTPEPSSILLLSTGAAALAELVRRRRVV